MKRRRILAALLALVMVLSTTTAIFAKDWSGSGTFEDVGKNDWFHGYVENLAAQKIVKGYGKTDEYRPTNTLSREEAAKMIAEAAGLTASPDFKSSFVDLDDIADWALPYVYALEEAGVIKGFGDTDEFRPKQPIERGHIAKMLVKAFGLEKGPLEVKLTDLDLVEKDPEVLAAIRILASNGIVSGFGTSNKYRPLEDIDRAAFAKIIAIAQATATVQKAEKDDATPEEIAQAKKLVGNLPDVEDKDTKKSLEGRLDDLEKEEEPEPGPGPVVPQVSAIKITTTPTDVSGLENEQTASVVLATTTADATIYYTLDGSNPTTESKKYTTAFEVKANDTKGKTVVVKAMGVRAGYTNSAVAEKSIVFKAKETTEDAELAQAIESAESAMSAYLNAGGKATDSVYSALLEALESNKTDNIKAATSELNQLIEKIEVAQSRLAKAEEAVKSAEAEVSQAQEKLETAKSQRDGEIQAIEAAQSRLAEAEEAVKSAEAAVSQAQEQLEAAEGNEDDKKAAEAAVSEAQEQLEMAKSQRDGEIQVIEAAKSELAEAEEAVKSAQAVVSQAQEHLEAVEAELLEAEEHLASLLSGAEK